MAKVTIKKNPQVDQIFGDLEKYLEFCVEYGYVFDEAGLYNQKNPTWRQFVRFTEGKAARNNWAEDRKREA